MMIFSAGHDQSLHKIISESVDELLSYPKSRMLCVIAVFIEMLFVFLACRTLNILQCSALVI